MVCIAECYALSTQQLRELTRDVLNWLSWPYEATPEGWSARPEVDCRCEIAFHQEECGARVQIRTALGCAHVAYLLMDELRAAWVQMKGAEEKHETM